MNRMDTLTKTLILFAILTSGWAENICQDCSLLGRECHPLGLCTHGFANTSDNCCRTCLRGEGEQCGGITDICGVCREGLQCKITHGMRSGNCHKAPLGESHKIKPKRHSGPNECYDIIQGKKRRFGEYWFRGCNVDTCLKSKRIHSRKIECGIDKCSMPIGRRCCSVCKIKIESVLCRKNELIVTLRKAMKIPVSRLTLADPSCGAIDNNTNILLKTKLENCGTEKIFTKSKIIFRNKVIFWERKGLIIYRSVRKISCSFPNIFKPPPQGIRVKIAGSGAMMYYTTNGGRIYLSRKKMVVNSGEIVHVAIIKVTDRLNLKQVIMVDECFLTPASQESPKNKIKHILIQDGCRRDDLVQILRVWPDGIWFSLKAKSMFGPTGNLMILQCTAHVCDVSSRGKLNKPCSQSCLRNEVV